MLHYAETYMLMFICQKTKNIVSSWRAPLVRLVSSLQSPRYNWKGDFYICVPMTWEFRVFHVWKFCALLEDPARTGLAVWRKRESSCSLLGALLAVFWPCGWFQEIGGGKIRQCPRRGDWFCSACRPDMALSAQNSSADSALQKVPVLQVSLLYLIYMFFVVIQLSFGTRSAFDCYQTLCFSPRTGTASKGVFSAFKNVLKGSLEKKQ